MKTITLFSGEVALVDDAEYLKVSAYKWYVSRNNRGHVYATTTIEGKWVGMHRFILSAPKGVLVDHVNSNGLDNRKNNLRLSDYSQNRANSKSHRAVPKGVYPRKQRTGGVVYRAQIRHHGHLTNLGTFKTIGEAANVYAKAAVKFHGEFARAEN